VAGGGMTDEQIIWWAQDAGCSNLGMDVGHVGILKMFKRFAEAVAKHERNACVAIIDSEMDEWDDYNMNVALNNIAADMRHRGC
jgi:hypothetical protein